LWLLLPSSCQAPTRWPRQREGVCGSRGRAQFLTQEASRSTLERDGVSGRSAIAHRYFIEPIICASLSRHAARSGRLQPSAISVSSAGLRNRIPAHVSSARKSTVLTSHFVLILACYIKFAPAPPADTPRALSRAIGHWRATADTRLNFERILTARAFVVDSLDTPY